MFPIASTQFIASHSFTICNVICVAYICHTSHNTAAICNWHNFDKYNIFHKPDEAMLFVVVKDLLQLDDISILQNLWELCSSCKYKWTEWEAYIYIYNTLLSHLNSME